MSCNSPIAAWQLAKRSPTGKRVILFKPRGLLTEALFLPCGKCTGCRLERSRGWAIRCLHESKMHAFNSFITLTYDDAHLPSNGSLVLRDVQLFMKRLRAHFFRKSGLLIRHYGCGEYGDLNQRPHYHIIIFGADFLDKRLYKETPRGDKVYTSALLDEIWGMGACKIGDVNFHTAAYVARYVMKKVDGAKREAGHYLVYDMDGVISERVPEFSFMSKRGGGIGSSYFRKFGNEVMAHDSLIVNGREVPSIRYYDLMFEALDASAFHRVKRDRQPQNLVEIRAAVAERTPRRMAVKEAIAISSVKSKRRDL